MKRKILEKFIDEALDKCKTVWDLENLNRLCDSNIQTIENKGAHNKRSKVDRDNLKKYYLLRNRISITSEAIIASKLEEQRLYLEKDKLTSSQYRYKARFIITPENIKEIKGYKLLQKLGFYNKDTNPNGVVMDHRYSIYDGIKNNIDPSILGKIKNCEFLYYQDNLRKSKTSSISLSELLDA